MADNSTKSLRTALNGGVSKTLLGPTDREDRIWYKQFVKSEEDKRLKRIENPVINKTSSKEIVSEPKPSLPRQTDLDPEYDPNYRSSKDPWLSQDYNRKFSITDLRNKITGLNQLSKFYFDFPEIRNNRFVRNGGEESKIAEWVNESPEILENIYFYSENVTIPMRGINTDPHTYANGFRFESPVSSNYGDGDIAITMIVDHKYKIYDFFMNWMNSIHDKTTGYFSFHNRYTTDLDIYQLNNIGVEFSKDNTFDSMIADRSKRFFNYRVHLGNCYPKSVSAIEFKHESRDERVKITVNFTYEKVLYDREIKT